MSDWRLRLAFPALAAFVGLVVLELAYGVPLDDLLVFLLYQAGFVLLPGCLLLAALSSRNDGPLRALALGWGLGYILSILAFMLTAALGVRDLFLVYPILIIVIALALIRPRGVRDKLVALAPSPVTSRFAWSLTIVLIVGMAYFAVAYFTSTPLPGHSPVTYFDDYAWHISLAAEAKHHWPIEDPHAVGAPQPYHYYVHLQMAATSQVTGLDLPLLFFRLSPLPLVALFVLQLVAAGRSLAGSAWAGLIGAALFLLVGDLQMDADPTASVTQFPFLGLSFPLLFLSPSFLFGMVFSSRS